MNYDRGARAERALITLSNRLSDCLPSQRGGNDGFALRVETGERQTVQQDGAAKQSLTFRLPAGVSVDGVLHVQNYGGNVYFVTVVLGDHQNTFNVCMPHGPHHVAGKAFAAMCRYVESELKRHLGDRVLTNAAQLYERTAPKV